MNDLYLETLSLLSDSLHNKVSNHINADILPEVLSELQAQAVSSLVAKNVSSMDLSFEDKNKYIQILASCLRTYNNIALEQNKVLNSLRDADINVVVLKGTSATRYYSNPECRTMGDIDILVSPEDFDRAYSVIDSLGFVPEQEEFFKRHIGFHNADGLEIELHRHFSSVGTKEQQDYLDKRLFAALPNSEDFVLPEVENGLVLIGHVAQHLRSGLGLRQLVDWLMYAEANLTDKFWSEEFSIPVKKCGFEKLAKVSTAVCRKYLGLSLDISWCDDVDDSLIDSFVEYIMDQGNFGRKHKSAERDSVTVLNYFRNPVALFKYLQAGGKTHWKLARTNKFFGCFAWIYQIGRIIKMGFTRKVGVKNLKRIHDESKDIVKLMSELEIKEY